MLPGLIARVAGVVVVPWLAMGLRKGWPLALSLGLALGTCGVLLLPPGPGPAGLEPSGLLVQGLLGLSMGLVAGLPLLAVQVTARLLGWSFAGHGWPWAHRGTPPRTLSCFLVLLAAALFLAGEGHRVLFGLWMAGVRNLPLLPGAASDGLRLSARALALALGDWVALGMLLALPMLLLVALGSLARAAVLRAEVQILRPDGEPALAAALLLLGLALWLALGLWGVDEAWRQALQALGWMVVGASQPP